MVRMDTGRILRHLLSNRRSVRRAFPAASLEAIERAIRECEATHYGEIRFAVEGALHTARLLRGQTARDRALELFASLEVWDTERNNGVLIYLLLADRDVEIVADRGAHAKVGTEGWEAVCRVMEDAFSRGRFEEGAVAGIRAVSDHLARHFPGRSPGANQLPDSPLVL